MKDASHTYWESRWSQTSAESLKEVLQPYHQGKDEILDVLKAHRVRRICDAGCGFGAYSLLLASNGFDVEGFDLSESAVAVTKELLGNYKIDASSYRAASVLQTGYADEQFDAAIAYSVLDHMTVNDAAKGLRELSRIVRKDGLLVLAFDSLEEDDLELAHTVMPDGSLLYTQGKRTGMIFHPFTEQELSEMLDNKEVLYRRTSTKGERVLVVRNSPAVYK
mgnify:CR=1 FL=1